MQLTHIEEKTEYSIGDLERASSLILRFEDIEMYKGTEVRSNGKVYYANYKPRPEASSFVEMLREIADRIEADLVAEDKK
jgi:hypothetical protein